MITIFSTIVADDDDARGRGGGCRDGGGRGGVGQNRRP